MSKDEKDIVLVIVLKNIWDLLAKRNLQSMVQSWDEVSTQLDLNEDNVLKIDKVNDDLWMLKIANMDKWTLVDNEKADESNDDNDEHEHPLGNLLGDLSLKEGVKIHVSSKFKREKSAKDANSVIGTSMGVGLTPPPAAGSTIFVKLKPPPTLVDVTNANDDNSVSNGAAATFADNGGDNGNDYSDDDFGDFEG